MLTKLETIKSRSWDYIVVNNDAVKWESWNAKRIWCKKPENNKGAFQFLLQHMLLRRSSLAPVDA